MVQNFILKCPGKLSLRYDFAELFAEAWGKAMTIQNIYAGFKLTNKSLASILEPRHC